MSHANSICAFSGLNDFVNGPTDFIVQSYGQDVRLHGAGHPRAFNPGDACGAAATRITPRHLTKAPRDAGPSSSRGGALRPHPARGHARSIPPRRWRSATTRRRSSPAGSGSGPTSARGRSPTTATTARPTSYVLEMLPYPSGEPHIGHLKVYSVGDAVAHFHRRTGRRVLHPMGYDAFGLPAENHAIQTGQHPRESTDDVDRRRSSRQFREWGISIDWTREFATCEPEYYRWTQWIFLQLFERGLAYREDAAVNWCPNDADRARQRAGRRRPLRALRRRVEIRQLEQWFFRITDYADRLLDDLDTIELARARQDDAAQLDRPLRGRRGHVPLRGARRSTTRSSRRGPTRSSARRSSSWRPSTPTSSGWSPAPSARRRCATTSTTR